MNIEDKIKLITAALEDVKAQDISVLDTSKLTALFERMVIATGTSNRQTRALADHVHIKVKEAGSITCTMTSPRSSSTHSPLSSPSVEMTSPPASRTLSCTLRANDLT